jgi:hypothetical protein
MGIIQILRIISVGLGEVSSYAKELMLGGFRLIVRFVLLSLSFSLQLPIYIG